MPPRYEAMRDKFKGEGLGDAAAKGKAARIFNATRAEGEAPVTRGAEGAARPPGKGLSALIQGSKHNA